MACLLLHLLKEASAWSSGAPAVTHMQASTGSLCTGANRKYCRICTNIAQNAAGVICPADTNFSFGVIWYAGPAARPPGKANFSTTLGHRDETRGMHWQERVAINLERRWRCPLRKKQWTVERKRKRGKQARNCAAWNKVMRQNVVARQPLLCESLVLYVREALSCLILSCAPQVLPEWCWQYIEDDVVSMHSLWSWLVWTLLSSSYDVI